MALVIDRNEQYSNGDRVISPQPTLHTQRLHLRPFTLADAPDVQDEH